MSTINPDFVLKSYKPSAGRVANKAGGGTADINVNGTTLNGKLESSAHNDSLGFPKLKVYILSHYDLK